MATIAGDAAYVAEGQGATSVSHTVQVTGNAVGTFDLSGVPIF
jgi:hypothetical protein